MKYSANTTPHVAAKNIHLDNVILLLILCLRFFVILFRSLDFKDNCFFSRTQDRCVREKSLYASCFLACAASSLHTSSTVFVPATMEFTP